VTYNELLTEIDNAIKAILQGAQSYSIGNRTLTRANLAELRRWRQEIYPLAQQESNNNEIKIGYIIPEW